MNPVMNRIDILEVGDPIQAGDLTIFPLLGTLEGGPAYLTLDEAMASELIEVMEVDEAGRVGELTAVNRADRPVLIVEGEQLIGAKQNRTVNTSILLAPNATVHIPVSCTEAGRWYRISRGFHSSPHHSHPGMRRGKSRSVSESLRRSGSYRSDQRAVWAEVDRVACSMSVDSATADYEAVMEKAVHSRRSAMHQLDAIELPPDAVGVAVCARGRVEGVDIFDRPQTMHTLWPKLSRGYALCGLDSEVGPRAPITEAADIYHFMVRAASAACELYLSPGGGESVRIDAPDVTGSGLTVGSHLVHVSIFGVPGE